MSASNQLVLSLHSRGDTRRLGRRLAACLQPGDVVVLEGDLGAGKTFLARSIARGLGVPAEVRVTSPSFDLVHELPARTPLLHLDLYRLEEPSAIVELGVMERAGADAIVLVEWGDRFADLLGNDGLWLALALDGARGRSCRITARGTRGVGLLGRFQGQLALRDFHGSRCPGSRKEAVGLR